MHSFYLEDPIYIGVFFFIKNYASAFIYFSKAIANWSGHDVPLNPQFIPLVSL